MKLNISKGGKCLSAEELSSLISNDANNSLFEGESHLKAMDKIHSLVCVRERTRKECYERLLSNEFQPDVARKAVVRAVECGLIDEERYAAAFIRGKVNSGWGQGRIVRQLEENGVDSTTVQSCAYLFPRPEEEYSRAYHELEKHPARSKNPRATYLRRLAQKGFSSDISIRAVNDFLRVS